MLKKFLSIFMALALTLTLLPAAALADEADIAAPTAAATVFTDVDGHWAEGAIARWSDYGVVQGSAGKFDPNGGLTCAQMATILDNLLRLGAAGSAGFTDVASDAWYAGAINRCAAAGILNGNGDGTVDPDSPITRERAMVILARALGIAPKANADLKSYSDRSAVSGYAAPYVAALIDAGIVSGMTDTTLAPQDGINRASTVTILDRAISTYANEKGASVAASGEGITLVVADEVTITGDAGTLLVPTDNIGVTLDGSKAADSVTITGDNATVTVKSTAVESASVSGENSKLILESSNVGEVTVSGAKSTVETKGTTTVETVSVTEDAAGATVSAGSGTTVKSVENDAEDTTVTGAGKVSDVKSSTDVTVETKNTDVKNTGDETITVTDKNGKDADVSTGSGSSSSTTVNKDATTVSGGSSGGSSSSHEHSYAEGWTYDETDHWHAATCGDNVVSGKAAHTWNAGEVTKEATCAAAGEKTLTCTVCGATKIESIPATGEHTWNNGEVTKAATCVAEGEKLLTCTVCGATKTETIPATGAHTWNDGEVTKEPTELVKGEMTYTCTVCGATKTEEIIATGEHDLVHHAAAAADCHAPGTDGNVEYWECRECHKLFTDESGASAYEVSADTVVIAWHHTPVEDAAKAATCTAAGKTAGSHCSVCDAVLVAQEVVPATGHAFGEDGRCTNVDANTGSPCKVTAVAKTGDTFYLTLDEAVTAVKGGDTLKLFKSGTTKNALTVSGTVVIDANGYSYTYSGAGSAITLTSGANLTIKSTKNSTGVKTSNASKATSVISIPKGVTGATLTVEKAMLNMAKTGSVLLVEDGAADTTVTLTNSALKTASTASGVGVYFASSGTLTITGGTEITGATGVQICAGKLIVDNATITGKKSAPATSYPASGVVSDGAALSILQRTGYTLEDVKVTGGTFSSNAAVAVVQAYSLDGTTVGAFNNNSKNNDKVVALSGGAYQGKLADVVPLLCADGYHIVCTASSPKVAYEVTTGTGDVRATLANGGTVYFQKLTTALGAAPEGATVVLDENADVGGVTPTISRSLTLDLNGNTLTGAAAGGLLNVGPESSSSAQITVTVKNGTLNYSGETYAVELRKDAKVTLKDVTVNAPSTKYAIAVGSNADDAQPELTIDAGTSVIGGKAGVMLFPKPGTKAVLNVLTGSGTIQGTSFGIAGNGGSNLYGETEINVYGGTITSTGTDGAAIYHPQAGGLYINGGTLTGAVAVQMCAGTLSVGNGIFVATGEDKRTSHTGDGSITDGAAISVVKRSGYSDLVSVDINGGTFKTANGVDSILAYTWDGSTAGTFTNVDETGYQIICVKGGKFYQFNPPADFLMNGYKAISPDEDGYYNVTGQPAQ